MTSEVLSLFTDNMLFPWWSHVGCVWLLPCHPYAFIFLPGMYLFRIYTGVFVPWCFWAQRWGWLSDISQGYYFYPFKSMTVMFPFFSLSMDFTWLPWLFKYSATSASSLRTLGCISSSSPDGLRHDLLLQWASLRCPSSCLEIQRLNLNHNGHWKLRQLKTCGACYPMIKKKFCLSKWKLKFKQV